MSEHMEPESPRSAGGPSSDAAMEVAVDEAGRQLRAPRAAAIAGLLFAILFTAALVLLRSQPMITADDPELVRLFSTGEDTLAVLAGLYLAPFAGVMFLALVFIATAAATAPSVGVRYLGQAAPTASTVGLMRALSYTFLFAFATRAVAVFLIATATIGLRSRVFPRWFAVTGYLLGVVLLLMVSFWGWIILVLPARVAVVSLFILRRERSRRRSG